MSNGADNQDPLGAAVAKLVRWLTNAGAVAVLLLIAFFIVRATGALDRHVKSERIKSASGQQAGTVYRLNRTVLDVDANFEIASCKTVGIDPILQDDQKDASGKTAYRLVDVKITDPKVTIRLEPDPEQVWRIVPDSIEGVWWSTTFSASLDGEGRLKEVNAASTSLKAEDVVRPVVTLMGKLSEPAASPIGRPVAAAAAAAPGDDKFCGPAIHDALLRRTAIEARLAAKPSVDEAAVLQTELERQNRLLKKRLAVTLVPRRPAAAVDPHKASSEDLQKLGLALVIEPQTLFPEAGDGLAQDLSRRTFEIRILTGALPVGSAPDSVDGVVHRIPAQARWVICRMKCTVGNDGEVPSPQVMKAPEPVSIPQIGLDGVIAIRRVPFSDRKAKIQFDAKGVVASVETSDTAQLPK